MVRTIGPFTVYAARSHVDPDRTGLRYGRGWFLEAFLRGRYIGICH